MTVYPLSATKGAGFALPFSLRFLRHQRDYTCCIIQLMKINRSPITGHKNRPYTPAYSQMYSGYMALVSWIPCIPWIPLILSILAFTGYSIKHQVSRDKTLNIRPSSRKGLRECSIRITTQAKIYLSSTWRERQEVMTANSKISGQASGFARINTYCNIYSGKAIDVLQEVNKKGMSIVETIVNLRLSKEGRIIIKDDKDGDIEVRLFNVERVNLNVHSRKLLDMLLMKLSDQLPYGEEATRRTIVEVFDITVTLDEFMKLCGLSDRKNARDHFRAAAECLFSLYMTFDYEVSETIGKRRKRTKKHFSSYLLDSTEETRTLDKDPVIDSRICVAFSVKLFEYLCTRYIMPLNIKIFAINPRNHPHAYTIFRYLSEIYRVRMNRGQETRIAVKTLLEKACPELPTVDEINNRHYEERHYARNIMKPVERDLYALMNIYGLITWEYTHKGGEPLTDDELGYSEEYGLTDDREYPYSFNEWLHFNIDFTLPDYPDTTERVKKYLAGKRKRAAAKKD